MDTVKLICGELAATVRTRGANCVSLRHMGKDLPVLHEGGAHEPFFCGMPLLFPVNRIDGGCFLFEGRKYCFPINEPETNCRLHGILHEVPFTLVRATEREAHLVFDAEEGAYLGFPHAFRVERHYALDERGLSETTVFVNRSVRTMPLLFGQHTAFSWRKGMRLCVELDCVYERGARHLLTGECSRSDPVLDALGRGVCDPSDAPVSLFAHIRGEGRAHLFDDAHGLTVTYTCSAQYPYRMLFGGGASAFVCPEPYTCLIDAFNAPASLAGEPSAPVLAPGERRELATRIEVEA